MRLVFPKGIRPPSLNQRAVVFEDPFPALFFMPGFSPYSGLPVKKTTYDPHHTDAEFR